MTDYNAMTRKELRQYVLTHPNDQDAFYALVDRFEASPTKQTYRADQIEEVLREKLGNCLAPN